MVLPYQGDWTVEEYLKLDTNRLIEFTDGFLTPPRTPARRGRR